MLIAIRCKTFSKLKKCSGCVVDKLFPPPLICMGENEEYQHYGCERTCQDPDRVACNTCESGCFCCKGFVRDDNGQCVTCASCKKKQLKTCSKLFEVYHECGNPCVNPCDPRITCADECIAGCYCDDGLIRDNLGNCYDGHQNNSVHRPAPIQRCKDINEVYSDNCGCEYNCYGLDPTCQSKCKRGCFCRYGWVRLPNGFCGPFSFCAEKKYGLPSNYMSTPNPY